MKKYINVIMYCFCPFFLVAQLELNNNGAILKINNGTNLRVANGSVDNQSSGKIDNNGNLYLDGTYNQITGASYTGGAASWLWFEGAANQNATGDAPLNIARLRVDNGNRLILGNTVNVSTDVDLTNNGNIELGANNLVLASGATIAGYNNANYIITNSTGYLQQEVGAGNVFFPVGNSSYNPATLNNAGTTDNLQVRVFDQVLDQGTTGPPLAAGVVNRTWMISEETVGGSDLTVTLQWSTADELAFDRLNSGVSHHLSGTLWDNPPVYGAATAAGADWTQTRGGFTSFSPFVVRDVSADLPVEMLYFEAQRNTTDEVQLDWATASELNNEGFEVERMLDNETEYTKVGYVAGQGSTLNTTNYQFLDPNSHTGVSYYRLRQVDFDGSYSYSAIRAVQGVNRNAYEVTVFPNPVHHSVNIRFGNLPVGVEQASIKIMTIHGRELRNFETAIKAHELLNIGDLDDLVPATYILSVRLDNGEHIVKRFTKRKE